MGPCVKIRWNWVLAVAVAAIGATLPAVRPATAAEAVAPSAGLAVELELTEGTSLAGELVAVTADEVRLLVDGAARTVAAGSVRRLIRTQANTPAVDRGPVTIIGVDGARLTGDLFVWQGETAILERREGSVSMPLDRVRTVVMRPQTGAEGETEPAWLEALPAEPTSDIVAVARGDGFELVECAIVEVAAETVTVLLDGERIPVKAGKVLGLSWVRPVDPAAGSGAQVIVTGGRLTAQRVEWSPEQLVLDGRLRLPGGMLAAIDYAAGRTVSMATLTAERVNVEPFFAALAVDGMKPFFAPRPVRGPGDPAADPTVKSSLLMRPRTVAVWRVPAGSRRFRGTLRRSGQASGSVAVRVLLDDTPAFAERLSDARTGPDADPDAAVADRGLPLDIDVSTARRLTIEVDFVPGDFGCPVRFDRAVFER